MYRWIAYRGREIQRDKRQDGRDGCVNWMSGGIEKRIICGYMDQLKGWFQ